MPSHHIQELQPFPIFCIRKKMYLICCNINLTLFKTLSFKVSTRKKKKRKKNYTDVYLDQNSMYAMQCGYNQSTLVKGSLKKCRVTIYFVIQHCNLAVLNLSVQFRHSHIQKLLNHFHEAFKY